ncbi:hypothetical protein LTR36_005876 [Oleoguttula mirabilis]|uniref:Ubiquitin-like domain-containing protein n=1 Tax=Oleoguttula mirabilis TaxID=1507867 RepID=A0AAV9JDM9_9PEZI|nr:hypothetical protein LTR36_005876 [Oleoguttula mirabilis]
MLVSGIEEHVRQGHYDLIGPDGEVILPRAWDTTIQPGWEISMHMWPMLEASKEEEKDKLVEDAAIAADAGSMAHKVHLGITDVGRKNWSKKDRAATSLLGNLPSPFGCPPELHLAMHNRPAECKESKGFSPWTFWMVGGKPRTKRAQVPMPRTPGVKQGLDIPPHGLPSQAAHAANAEAERHGLSAARLDTIGWMATEETSILDKADAGDEKPAAEARKAYREQERDDDGQESEDAKKDRAAESLNPSCAITLLSLMTSSGGLLW